MNKTKLNQAANEAQDALNDLMEIVAKWNQQEVEFLFTNKHKDGMEVFTLFSGRTFVKTIHTTYGQSKQG